MRKKKREEEDIKIFEEEFTQQKTAQEIKNKAESKWNIDNTFTSSGQRDQTRYNWRDKINYESDSQKESSDDKEHSNGRDDKLRKNSDDDAIMLQDVSSLDISKEAKKYLKKV